jgi:hypothetical protein
MDQNQIIEGNRLIARFMDKIIITTRWPDLQSKIIYHYSWNEIIPVVKKIQQLRIKDFSQKEPVMNALMDVEIDILWNAVVAFIKFYNTNNTPLFSQ